jgi:hypothetical protein
MSKGAHDQGFITNCGRFVNRVEAATIAVEAGQVNEEITFLFSEDMWAVESFGKHDYNEIEGYIFKGR